MKSKCMETFSSLMMSRFFWLDGCHGRVHLGGSELALQGVGCARGEGGTVDGVVDGLGGLRAHHDEVDRALLNALCTSE